MFQIIDKENDECRTLMYYIIRNIGELSKNDIDESSHKIVYFDHNYHLKSHPSDSQEYNIWDTYINKKCDDKLKKYLLLDLIINMVKIDRKERITAQQALLHPIFSLIKIDETNKDEENKDDIKKSKHSKMIEKIKNGESLGLKSKLLNKKK